MPDLGAITLSAVDVQALRDYLARAHRLHGDQERAVLLEMALLEMAGYLGAALDAAERRRDDPPAPTFRTSG
jgi:hypothetical protein